ncbi:conserved oligomeric Golgi complex subunit 7 [Microdochium nivale]|nr:conserved oligomeric Golgi complex subunit 7 [Microdochium nivale]
MATTRRRQNSSASHARGLPIQGVRPAAAVKQPAAPKSAHVSDPYLQSFLTPTFDPADYLNSILPPFQAHPQNARSQDKSASLGELSAQAQSEVSQLNAHTTRLTNTLTQLTDDILRSGSRLAYEVELLRGETLSLSEALTEGLADDIALFVPKEDGTKTVPKPPTSIPEPSDAPVDPSEPVYITQLRTLTLVRERLDSVVKTFGDAMGFVFPPSELSVSSSFLSVSAPEPGAEAHSTEDKGQLVLKALREEISDMITKSSDPVDGLEKATQRIEELKNLSNVWRGTAEEKGRAKFIDSLAKMVEDRHKELVRELEQKGRTGDKVEAGINQSKTILDSQAASSDSKGSGYGLMSQWQRLRTGL